METNTEFKHITETKLELSSQLPPLPSMGGYVLFAGVVRDINDGRQVTHLEYEAYSEMANQMIAAIIKDAFQKWDLQFADCIHRLGKLVLGEVAVIVNTGAIHRDEAYKANRYIIDRVKHEVPIWKKEYYVDGSSEWSQGCLHDLHEH